MTRACSFTGRTWLILAAPSRRPRTWPRNSLDAPISEDAMLGLAIGAAIEGLRPIIEMQFADFSTVAFNQIVNHAATLYWRTNVPCPITVRLPGGGTSGSGPFHSQSMEALYAHYPGLIVMTPATVEDAYSMLLEAVAIDDPVIFCEHKYLYYHLKAEALQRKRHTGAISSKPLGNASSDCANHRIQTSPASSSLTFRHASHPDHH